jgi:short-subunit dehydrogenase involved in D-alanine esterification of teichoic acids
VIKDHPKVDCLINNAGVQRPFQVLGPDYDFDLAKADQEIGINIRGPLHLSLAFLPHFNGQPHGGVIMNVSSVLGFLPYSVINPVYNGTKAWVQMFSMNLRTQLAQAGSQIRVVEIVPPSVGTDLHRERMDPDDNKRAKGGNVVSDYLGIHG